MCVIALGGCEYSLHDNIPFIVTSLVNAFIYSTEPAASIATQDCNRTYFAFFFVSSPISTTVPFFSLSFSATVRRRPELEKR
ncbi:hypothetical protein DI53_1945 [Sphingobacterium deserti]|uniref:Uncharacterized protein n=1 Tax=Sphingobacterium deserti TaxID=1229276 RepID=A0A0B8T148_9SPHI|nr:hypothetical protein DI53_1945 [Sphingobacterium deserti]